MSKLEKKRFDIINNDLNFVFTDIEDLLINYQDNKDNYLEKALK